MQVTVKRYFTREIYIYTYIIYRTGYLRNAEITVFCAAFGRETFTETNIGHPYMYKTEILRRIEW